MKTRLLKILAFVILSPALLFSQEADLPAGTAIKEASPSTPLFQMSAGVVYSSIDLSRYISSVAYRGYHFRLVTHLKGMFFLSTEYSTFRIHDSPSAWKNVSTRKFDINGHVSFATDNNLTRIFVLAGANKHEWHATRTGFTDQNQLANGIPEGEIINVNRWGVNFGCGFTQTLYENIGIFGDYRFCFAKSSGFEKVRIMDVMTTVGISLSFPHPQRKKSFGTGNKIYKWTKKGA
ncbi:MAG: hypothetical protein EPN85_10160 [Bacteroidetes bacterium]|nr:MAG: hypothetical protein EPN85_10160 [Bacteroidota bacterium]